MKMDKGPAGSIILMQFIISARSNKNCRKDMNMDIGPAGNKIIMCSMISEVVAEGKDESYSPENK